MDWVQIFVLLGGNVALILPLWLWSRAENRADQRGIDARIEASRSENLQLLMAIQAELKDFHGRLCAIEERRGK